MVGICANVETAGAPVSPLISAPNPLDFRRGRDIAPLDLESLLCRLWVWVVVTRSGNFSRVCDIVSRICGQDSGDWTLARFDRVQIDDLRSFGRTCRVWGNLIGCGEIASRA